MTSPNQRSLFQSVQQWFSNQSAKFLDRLSGSLDRTATPEAIDLPQVPTWANWSNGAIVGVVGVTIGWSFLARIDTVVAAQGKLDADSQAIQSRAGGVLTAVYVKEGQRVHRGDLLMQLDKTPLLQKEMTLKRQRFDLARQVAVLRAARQGISLTTFQAQGVPVSQELLEQAQTRSLLVAKLSGRIDGLTPDQLQRLSVATQQINTKLQNSDIDAMTLQTQAAQSQAQVEEAQMRLDLERQQLARLQPLAEQGGISRSDLIKQTESAVGLQSQLSQAQLAKSKLEMNVAQSQLAKVDVINASRKEAQDELAKIDEQTDATILSTQRQIADLDGQLGQIQTDIQQQDLKAPLDGIVFSLQNKIPGVVTQSGQALLQVTPNGTLIAKVGIPNKDMAGIHPGMPVDLRIDAFPSTEFGSVKGEVETVGSDALPPDNAHAGQSLFPVEIRLNQQMLSKGGKEFALTPGLSVVANLKTGSRAPIRFIADEIFKVFDEAQSIR
jgi:HlyD family type I secretion membrane fusion protein